MTYLSAFIFSLTFTLAADQDKILDIKKSLMAPCCWSGTVYDHGNQEMESEIAELVRQGKTRDEIIHYFVNEKRIVHTDGRVRYGYGERILAIPVAEGFNLLVWIVPSLLAIAAFTILGLYIKTSKKTDGASISGQTPEIPFDEEIERELKELD